MKSNAASAREEVEKLVESLRKLADKLALLLCGYSEHECIEHLSIEFDEYVEQFESYIEDVCRKLPEDKCLSKARVAYEKTVHAMCTDFCMQVLDEYKITMDRCMDMCLLKAGLADLVFEY